MIAVVAVAGVLAWAVFGSGGGDGPTTPDNGDPTVGPTTEPSPDDPTLLPELLTGSDEQQALPETGARLQAGLATIEIRPLSVSEPVTVRAELAADRTLTVTMDPEVNLDVPAYVILPLPIGAEAGDNPATWPVAYLESAAGEPLILQPEAVDERTFAVLVPHFSTVTPMTHGAAAVKAGGKAPSSDPVWHPVSLMDVSISLPENPDPNAEVTQVLVTITPRARTKVNGGRPVLDGGKLAPGWEDFESLKVGVFDSFDEASANFFKLAEGEIRNGQPITLTVSARDGWKQLRSVYIRMDAPDGYPLVHRAIALPNGKYWKAQQCTALGEYEDLNITYLWDPRSTGHPDTNYTGEAKAQGLIPARVFDACAALSEAYQRFNHLRWFNDPGNAPDLPMTVFLQPWRENEAGNTRNWISLRTSAGTWEEFRRDAAHEMAHRFQHAYSIGYTGGWFHEASAEYLAIRLYSLDEQVADFVGLAPQWINVGFTNGQDTDFYSSSAFLAYLSSAYGFNIARFWVEGGTGLANLQSWQAYIDSRLKEPTGGVGLPKAWADFGKLYLVDHSPWGTWTGLALEPALFPANLMELSARKSYYARETADTPYLSAGGRIIRVAGDVPATIGYRITDPNQGNFQRSADYWISPGLTADGRGTKIELTGLRPLEALGSVRVGNVTGSFSTDGIVRITYVYSDWEGRSPISTPLTIEAWALLAPEEVERNETTGRITWKPSPMETLANHNGTGLFEKYEVVVEDAAAPGKWIVVETFEGGEEEYETVVSAQQIRDLKGTGLPCVRIADIYGNASPESCPEPAPLLFRLTLFETFEDSRPVFDAFLAGQYGPMHVVGCLSNPGNCYIAIYRPAGEPKGSLAIAVVGSDKNLATGMIFASNVPSTDPAIIYPNLAEIVGDTAIGTYHTSIEQWQEAKFTMTDTSISGYLRIVAMTTEDDPYADHPDGFPVDDINIRIEGTLVE